VIDNEAIRWGHRLERPVAEEFAEVKNRAIVEWPVSLQWKEKPWMLANLDFLEVIPSEQFPAGQVTVWENVTPPPGILRIVEIKTSGVAGFGTAHQWFVDGEDTAPLGYQLQVLHYQIVSGIYDGVLVGLLAGHGLTVREIAYDEATADGLIAIEANFWNNHVLEGLAPEPDGSESAESTLKALYPRGIEGKEAEGGAVLAELRTHFERVKADFTVIETEKKATRAKILALMGDADYATINGQRVYSFKNSKDGTKFNETKFKAENADLYAEYEETKPGHRTLREITEKPKGVEA
jgi:predicted phage-related endonuclease